MTGLDPIYIRKVVESALAEDTGSGDITTLLTIPREKEATGTITAKAKGIIAGLDVARAVFNLVDHTLETKTLVTEGYHASPGDVLMIISGSAHGILTGERTALNFLQQMSGVATLTRKYVDMVAHTGARIVDTRKTVPGLRRLQKYAVTVGGGYNHRFGLADGILIKDNHIAAAGGVTPAIEAARNRAPHTLKIEVEVASLEQLKMAIDAGADIVMLDNMDLEQLRNAVEIADGRVLLEASGGVNQDTVVAIAETGVDIISVGALTHSAPALDVSLNITQT